jgi:hypothetical protein
MTENLTHILVFRTNINTESDKLRVREFLSAQNLVEDWNVDMDDIDRVLRIVSHELCAEDIIRLINKIGYQCQEL